MKIIASQTITAVTATSEDTEFPVSRLLGDNVMRKYKADGDYQTTITFSIEAGTTGLALFGTNADRAVCNLSDPNAIEWVGITWIDFEWISQRINTTTEIIELGESTAIWVEFEGSSVPLELDATLTNETETVYAGAALAGVVQSFRNPQYGLQEAGKSNSILKTLPNGSQWGRKRQSAKTFAGQFMPRRDDDELYSFLATCRVADIVDPMAWRVTDLEDNHWCLFARLSQLPVATHQHFRHSPTQFTITEAL